MTDTDWDSAGADELTGSEVADAQGPDDVSGAEPTPAQADIMRRIREEMVVHGRLPAERTLAEKLDVKRHQLRIALRYLREHGEVPEPRPRNPRKPRKTEARDMVRNTNPLEVIELRIMIEPTLARLAALRATPNMISEMKRTAALIARDGPARAGDLHRMIAAASGNALASELYDLLRKVESDVRLNANVTESVRPASDNDEHRELIAAIAARDPESAERTMRAHLMSIHRMMLSAGIA